MGVYPWTHGCTQYNDRVLIKRRKGVRVPRGHVPTESEVAVQRPSGRGRGQPVEMRDNEGMVPLSAQRKAALLR